MKGFYSGLKEGGARDAVWLSFVPQHSGQYLLPATTAGKVHRTRSTTVYCLFIKAFDTVGRTELWQLQRKYICHEKLPTIIESLHTGNMVNVRTGGEVSDTFALTNIVKQGCVLARRLFYLSFSNARRDF